MSVISVSHLSKSFQTFRRREGVWGSMRDLVQRDYQTLNAVDDISFEINEGDLVGYIGANGAGKSTSIKMLTGILKPSSGQMSVLGFDPFVQRQAYTKHIGVVFGQRTQLWWDIAVIESLRLLGNIYDVSSGLFEERLKQLTEILQLEEVLHTPVRKLSLGQRIRSDLAASLIHQPRVLFLDEPTIGLDAVAKDSVRRFLKQINKDFRTTIILTTHDLLEIEELCQRVLIIDHGKMIYDGSLARVKSMSGLSRRLTVEFTGEAPVGSLQEVFGDRLRIESLGDRRLSGEFLPSELPPAELLREIVTRYSVADISVEEAKIEDVVMKIYRDGFMTEVE